MSTLKKILHYGGYAAWLAKEIMSAGLTTASLVFRKDAIHPVILHYPLRVTSDWDIFWFSTSITATPGTLSLGLRHPARPGEPVTLLVHAVEGSNPEEVFTSLADMEARLNPEVAQQEHAIPWTTDSVYRKEGA